MPDGLAVQRARAPPGTPELHTPARTWRSSVMILRFQARSSAERVVGDLADPDVGNVHDDHAELGGRGHVDDVVADPGAHHGLEPLERAHHVAGDRRGRDDERVGVAGAGDHLVLVADEGQRGHRAGTWASAAWQSA